MTKFGTLSLDLVVACQIYELQLEGIRVEYSRLVDSLDGWVGESTIPSLLRTLADWGIVTTEFGETESGRAGRFYYISGEASNMIQEIYQLLWRKIRRQRKHGG